MKKLWQVLAAVCFGFVLSLPVGKADAATFTFTPAKPAAENTAQTADKGQAAEDTTPKVQSLKLAVVPLMIGEDVEDNQGMKPIVFSNELAKLFQYPAYDMVDSDVVRKVALQQQDNLFTKAGLQAVAEASGADVVIVMAVDKFDVTEQSFRREPVTDLDFEGRFATLNNKTGKFKDDHWSYTQEMESGAISPRSDWPHKEFVKLCRRELKKALKNN